MNFFYFACKDTFNFVYMILMICVKRSSISGISKVTENVLLSNFNV